MVPWVLEGVLPEIEVCVDDSHQDSCDACGHSAGLWGVPSILTEIIA